MSNDLLNAIDRLVEEKTFNLDALDAIKNLRNQAESLEERRDELVGMCERYRSEIKGLTDRIAELEKQSASLTSTVAMHKEREQEADEAIYAAEKHRAVAEAYKDAMNIVFKPNAVRERVHQNIPVPMNYSNNGNGYTNVVTYTQSSDITKEDV